MWCISPSLAVKYYNVHVVILTLTCNPLSKIQKLSTSKRAVQCNILIEQGDQISFLFQVIKHP